MIWGLLHGIGILVARQWEASDWYRERVPTLLKRMGVFAFVCLGWIFFRAESVSHALAVLKQIVVGGLRDPYCPLLLMALAVAVWSYQAISESRWRSIVAARWVQVPLAAAMVAVSYTHLTLPTTPYV